MKPTKKGQSTAVRTPATAMDRPLLGTFDLTHLQSFAGTYGMGRGADADALCDGVGDVEDLADHLGQQVGAVARRQP